MPGSSSTAETERRRIVLPGLPDIRFRWLALIQNIVFNGDTVSGCCFEFALTKTFFAGVPAVRRGLTVGHVCSKILSSVPGRSVHQRCDGLLAQVSCSHSVKVTLRSAVHASGVAENRARESSSFQAPHAVSARRQ